MTQLIQQYRETFQIQSERDKAVMERRIFTAVKIARIVKPHCIHAWMHEQLKGLDVRSTDLIHRRTLLTIDEPSLWARVEGHMTLSTAARIAKDAKDRVALQGGDTASITADLLSEYDNPMGTFIATLPSGKVVRKKKNKVCVSMKTTPDGDAVDAGDSRKLWAVLQSTFEDYLTSQLPSDQLSDKSALAEEYQFQVRAVFDDLRREVRNRRNSSQRATEKERAIGQYALKNALATLGLPPPKKGKKLDMNAVKAKYRKLATLFHTDHNRNASADELMKLQGQYDAVIKAHEIIKQYAAQFEDYHG